METIELAFLRVSNNPASSYPHRYIINYSLAKRIAPGQELFLDYGPKYWEVTGDALDSTLSDQ